MRISNLFWYLELQTDYLIPTRIPYLEIIDKKKENLSYSGVCRPNGPRIENRRKQNEKNVWTPSQITKKAVKHKGDHDTNCN